MSVHREDHDPLQAVEAREELVLSGEVPETGEEPGPEDPGSAEGSGAMPRRPHWVTEAVLLFGAITAVEWWARSGAVGFHDYHPHPYWAVVLLLAAARGVSAALLSAVIATTLYAVGVLAAAEVGRLQDLFDLEHMRDPVLFFAVGFVVGQFREGLASRYRHLRERHRRVCDELAQRRRDCSLLTHANRELQRKVFEESADFNYLITVLSSVEAVADPDAFDLPLSLLEDHCGASKCSVLLVMEDGTVDLAHNRGWEENEIRHRIGAASASLQVRQAITEARPILSFEEGRVSEGGPLMVAPIADITGVIKALLCIDEIPPQRFTDSMVGTFLGIAEWVAAKMRRMHGGAVVDSRDVLKQVSGSKRWIGTPDDLSERIFLEDARCNRQGVASSILSLQALDLPARIPGFLDRMDEFLLDHVCDHVRYTDDVYRFGYPGCYVVVLTGSLANGAEIVRRRLLGHLGKADTRAIGRVELEVVAPDADCTDLASLLPRITEGFHRRSPVPLEPRCPVPVPHPGKPGDAMAFVRRLRLEIELARRHDLELNLIDFSGDNPDIDVGQMIGRHIWNIPFDVLRATDGIYVLGPNRCVVVLPATGCVDAVRVWQRLQDTLRKTIPEERFECVHADFLALSENDAEDALRYLVGVEKSTVAAPPDEPILSDIELRELAFSEFELTKLFTEDARFREALEGAEPGEAEAVRVTDGAPDLETSTPSGEEPASEPRAPSRGHDLFRNRSVSEAVNSILRCVDSLDLVRGQLHDLIDREDVPEEIAGDLAEMLRLCDEDSEEPGA